MTGEPEIAPPREDELVVVVGPTATGKTELAIELAEAWGGEIVSADSVQIYRLFDVGSGKPSAAERARAVHHLVDCIDPREAIDAQRFAELAGLAIDDIRSRGRVPIVCGGAFLWVRALTLGLAPAPPADQAIRARHADFAATHGRRALHDRLTEVDPVSAGRIAPNDFVRVSRALEVHEITGRTLADWHAAHGFRERRHDARLVGVRRPAAELDERILSRVMKWLDAGWVDEVRRLQALGLGEARAMGSVGYRQISEMLAGRLEEGELLSAIVRATRVFVRRQRTWLRDEQVTWVDRDDRVTDELDTYPKRG
jgi:tRNA dimethylallyltransferase